MHLLRTQLTIALGVFVLAPTTIAAMPFLPTSQDRFVESRAEIGTTIQEQRVSSSDLLPFVESVQSRLDIGFSTGIGNASQSSSVTSDGFLASGSIFTSGFSAGLGLARSEAEFIFEVSETSSYSLSGEVFGESDATSLVQLLDSSGGVLESFVSFQFGNGGPPGGAFSGGGTLPPGEYRFRAVTYSCSDELGICGQDVGFGSFAASLVIVPEPSTAILIFVGLAILCGRDEFRPSRFYDAV
jgi:hypothetical protein